MTPTTVSDGMNDEPGTKYAPPGAADALAPGGLYFPDIVARQLVRLLDNAAQRLRATARDLPDPESRMSMLLRDDLEQKALEYENAWRAIERARDFAEAQRVPLRVNSLSQAPAGWLIAAIPLDASDDEVAHAQAARKRRGRGA